MTIAVDLFDPTDYQFKTSPTLKDNGWITFHSGNLGHTVTIYGKTDRLRHMLEQLITQIYEANQQCPPARDGS